MRQKSVPEKQPAEDAIKDIRREQRGRLRGQPVLDNVEDRRRVQRNNPTSAGG